MTTFQSMPANNRCRWCGMRRFIGFHSLCKQWYIFKIRDYIDKMENYIMALENLVDDLEGEPA